MYHIAAYRIASAGGLTNQDIPALSDGFASVFNNHLIFQKDWMIDWAAVFGLNVTNARLNTPYLRQIQVPSIQPIDTAATPTSIPAIAMFRNSQIKIRAIDETALEATDAAVAGNITAVIGLRDELNNNIPPGPISVFRFTSALTAANGIWSSGAMTLDQGIPAGRYAVIGMDCIGANLIAARLQFATGGNRPGCIARTAVTNKPDPMFLNGSFGNWGEFENTAPPLLDLLGNAAPVTQTTFLKVVKVR